MAYRKLYEEMLERAEESYQSYKKQLEEIENKSSNAALLLTGSISALEQQFPELITSKDNLIKEVLLEYLESELANKGNELWNGDLCTKDIIAWVDKQGQTLYNDLKRL